MNQLIHNPLKKVSAVMAAVLLSLTLASCGGGGGGGGSTASGNPLAPGAQQGTGNVKVVIPGTSRGSAAARNASLIPAGASNFLVQVVDFNNRNLVLGFADEDRTADDKVIEVNGIPAGMVFVKVFARAADRTTVLALSEDVASVLAGQSTPVAAVMGVSIRQVESATGEKTVVVQPSSFTLKQGDTLVIGNTSPVPVNLTTKDPGAKFGVKLGGFSKQFRVIVSDPGTYTFNDASGATFTLTVEASSGAIPLPLAATVGPLFGRSPHDLSLSVRLQGDTSAGLAAGSVLWDFQDGNVGGVSFAPGATDPHITRKSYETPGTYVVRLCAVETGTIAACALDQPVAGLVRDFKFNVSIDRPAATINSADYLALDLGNEWSYQMFDYLAVGDTGTGPAVRAASQLGALSGTEVLPDIGTSGPQTLVKKVVVADAGESKNGFAAKVLHGIVDANRDGVHDATDGAFEKLYFYVDTKGDYNLYRIIQLRPGSGPTDPGVDFDFTLEPPMIMAKATMTEGQSVTSAGSVTGTQAGGQSVSGTYSNSITFVSFHPVGAIAGFFDDAVQIDRRLSFTINGEVNGRHDVGSYARGTGQVLRSDLELMNGIEVPGREDVLVHAVVDGLEIGGSSGPGDVPAGDIFPLVSVDDRWIFGVAEFTEPATGFPSASSSATVRASKALSRRKASRSASVLPPGQRIMQAKLRELIPGNNGVTAVVERIYDNNGDADAVTGEPIFSIHDGQVETDVFHVQPGVGVMKVGESSADFAQINKNEPFKQISGERSSMTPGIPELAEPVAPNVLLQGEVSVSKDGYDEPTATFVAENGETWSFEYETLLVPEPVELTVGYFENLFVVSRLTKKYDSASVQIGEHLELTFLAPGVGPVLKTDEDVYVDESGQLVAEYGFAELLSARVGGLDFGVPPAGDGSPYVLGTYPYDGEFQFPTLNPQFAVFFSEPMQGDFSTASLTFQQLIFPSGPGAVRAFRNKRQAKVVCDPTVDPNCQPTCDPTLDPNCQPPTCDPMVDPNCQPPTCDPTLDPNCQPPTCDPAVDPSCGYNYPQPTLGPDIVISGDSVRPILASDLQPLGRYAGRKLPRGAKVLPTDIIGMSFTYNGELEAGGLYQVSAIDIPATLVSTATAKPLRQPVIDHPIVFGTTFGGFVPGSGGVPHAVAQIPGIGGNAPPDGQFAFIYDQFMDTSKLPTAFSFTLETFDPNTNAPVTISVDEMNYQSMDIGHWVWMFDGQADKLTFFLHQGYQLVNGQNYTLTWNVFPDVTEQSMQVASDATTYIDAWPTVDFLAGFSAGPGPFAAMGQFPQSGYGMAQGAALEFFFSDFVDTTQLPTTFEFTLTDIAGTVTTINAANASQFGYWGWGSGFSGEPKLSFFPNTETSLVDVSLAPYTLTWVTFPDVYHADAITAADFGLMETLVNFDVFPGGVGPGPGGGAPAITFFHPMEGGMVGERTSIFISFVGGINDAYTPSQYLFQIADSVGTITTIDANNAADYGHWEFQFTPNFEVQLHFVLDGPINLLTQAGSPYSLTWLQAPDVMPFDFSQVVDYSALPVGVPINFSVQAGGGVPGTFSPVMAFPGPSGAMVPEGSMFFFNFPPNANTSYLPQTFAFEVTDAASNVVTIDPANAADYGAWVWGTTQQGDPQLQFTLNGAMQLLSQAAGPYTLNWLQFPDVFDFSGQMADFATASPMSVFDVGPPGPIGPGPGPGGAAVTGLFPNNGDTMLSTVTIDIYYGTGVDINTLPTTFQFTLNGATYDAATLVAAGGNVVWTSNMAGNPTLAFTPPTGALIDNSSNTLVWEIFPDVYDATTMTLVDHTSLGALPLNITFGVTTGGPGPGPGPGGQPMKQYPADGMEVPFNMAGVSFVFDQPMDQAALPSAFQVDVVDNLGTITTVDTAYATSNALNWSWVTNFQGKHMLVLNLPNNFLNSSPGSQPYTFNWISFPQGLQYSDLTPVDWAALSGQVSQSVTVTVGGMTKAIATNPAPMAMNVPVDGAAFDIVFNNSMDNLTTPAAFSFQLTNIGTGGIVTIDQTNASQYGAFTWSSGVLPNDQLSFTLFTCSTLMSNGVPCMQTSTTYSVQNNVAPTNLTDTWGGSIDSSGMATSGQFTTAAPL